MAGLVEQTQGKWRAIGREISYLDELADKFGALGIAEESKDHHRSEREKDLEFVQTEHRTDTVKSDSEESSGQKSL